MCQKKWKLIFVEEGMHRQKGKDTVNENGKFLTEKS